MKTTLHFDINCGEKTCAIEKGRFCRFFSYDFSNKCTCHLFGRLYDEENGWILRHEDCLAAQKGEC